MNSTKKIAILLPILWPFLYAIAFLCIIAMAATNSLVMDERLFGRLFVVHIGTMLSTMALVIGVLVHIVKNPRLQGDQRVLWALVVLCTNIFAMPLYWYFQIWREGKGDPVAPPRRFAGPALPWQSV